MTIAKERNANTLTVKVEGRIDTVTSREFEEQVKPELDTVNKLILDMEKLNYISSAGLRLLLSLQKIMNKQGEMIIKNVNVTVNDIFDVTGFSEILTIE